MQLLGCSDLVVPAADAQLPTQAVAGRAVVGAAAVLQEGKSHTVNGCHTENTATQRKAGCHFPVPSHVTALTCKCVIFRSIFIAEVSQFSETYL